MSKTLLSRIKPLHNPKPASLSSSSPPHIKRLVNDTIQILRADDQWEQSLATQFSETETLVSDVAHFVLDRIHDVELGLKFFDWAFKRPYCCSPDGFAYSSLLKLLARFKVLSEIELVMEQMKFEEVKPTIDALSFVLRAYADSGLVDKALDFYCFVVKVYDCVPDVFACNTLLNVLVKNRRVDVAHRVYDEMAEKGGGDHVCMDNYSTCIMVKGLCKAGKVEEGRKLIEDRWGESCVPNVVFYNTLIDGYCKKGDVENANRLFKELKLKGFLPTLETYGAMINGYCKEGNFKAIDRLLMEMKERGLTINVQVHNSIVDARCKHGSSAKGVESVTMMIECGCEPDITTYNILINSSCKDGKVEEAEQFLNNAMERGLVPNKFSYTPLFHVYFRKGEHCRALDIFTKITERGHKPDLVSYGALIHGLVVSGEVDTALTVRDRMMENGVVPDAGIFNVLMSGLCKRGRLSTAKLLLAQMLDQNIPPDAFVYATLVDGLIRNGDLDEAKKLFGLTIDQGLDPGVVGYNAMIKGFCKFGMMKDALSCFKKMREVHHHHPDEFTYSTIIDGYVKQHNLDAALNLFELMIKQGCKPNVVTYTSLIYGFFHKGDSRGAVKTFREMQSCGMEPNVVTYSILIGNFCKEGKLAKAVSFFELMLKNKCIPNDVTFHYLVNGFTNNEPGAILEEVHESQENEKSIFLGFFGRMISDGWSQKAAVYNSINICLCHNGMVKTALQLCDKFVNKGIFLDSVSFAGLLYGICLEGRSKEWKNIISFDLKDQELQTSLKYSLILDDYLHQGRPSEATLVLQSLVEEFKSQDQEVDLTDIKT
ncbi:pentatricopeptide repeat-containing protein At1g52620 [Prunus avium]|uniref:Pentatricopeptide repeat-containing protein At1g52620 n=2 Tax=Prunus avium TaxID=42229 RepID=A0A6P5TTJ1_PRUAV|nr:pentatricopeptide repeat-containing protein At1g52620 [Prunus avium]XP_021830200.1 pentatricopeptide repeat-containing protein At1g52620 [Prunus avium]